MSSKNKYINTSKTKADLSRATNSLSWESSLISLNKNRTSKNIIKLKNADIHNIYHLLWILPNSVEEVPSVQCYEEMLEGQIFQGVGKIISQSFRPQFGRKGKGRAFLQNGSITLKDFHSEKIIELTWFNLYPSFIKMLKEKTQLFFLGKPSTYRNKLQLIAPEISDQPFGESFKGQAKYPTINSVPGSYIKRLLGNITETLWDNLFGQLPDALIQRYHLIPLRDAFKYLHGISQPDEDLIQKARERLIYEEFFIEQKNIIKRRSQKRSIPESVITSTKSELKKLESLFPYRLTEGQSNSLQEVAEDLASVHPMMRLIQGDVGCGKTTVAFITAGFALLKSHQAAIMCPTEALARQHFATLEPLVKKLGFSCCLLLGSQKAKEKKNITNQIEIGYYHLVIGTHALIQANVIFKNLRVAIIDEQHKFGVDQRIALSQKGIGVNTLIMTATPIPRSLCMTQYGDLEISVIPELPSDRRAVQTRIVTEDVFEKYLTFLFSRIKLQEQAYIVVPAIEETENMNLMYLEKVLVRFKSFFPKLRVIGIHGQLKANEKDEILSAFYKREIDILIATSVVEVGIDNPNATIMTIMNPERFGLSSLHQLRGRVGRGKKPGFCFLICDKNTPDSSKRKLSILEKTNSGFLISEEDLKNRGSGDLFGKQQSGATSKYKLANIIEHVDILQNVRDHFLNHDISVGEKHFTTKKQIVSTTI